MDVFKLQTGEVVSTGPEGIACWFINADYNEESFFVRHAYFLGANDPYQALKTTLKAEVDAEAWATLHSDTSRPIQKPKSGRIAVKVINHLGDAVMKCSKCDVLFDTRALLTTDVMQRAVQAVIPPEHSRPLRACSIHWLHSQKPGPVKATGGVGWPGVKEVHRHVGQGVRVDGCPICPGTAGFEHKRLRAPASDAKSLCVATADQLRFQHQPGNHAIKPVVELRGVGVGERHQPVGKSIGMDGDPTL